MNEPLDGHLLTQRKGRPNYFYLVFAVLSTALAIVWLTALRPGPGGYIVPIFFGLMTLVLAAECAMRFYKSRQPCA